MESLSYNCERPCHCKETHYRADLVVLTGGPGAGKTAVLESVRKMFCEHVAILPEAASVLFKGGFWRLNSPSAKKAVQRAIFHVQQEAQNLVIDETKWAMGLCDRGTIDGAAYWPGSESDYFDNLGTTPQKEYAKYKAVIHLRSPGSDRGYNFQNPMRIETVEEAAEIDQKIHEIWKHHPHYVLVESTQDFIEKVNIATHHIQAFIPECCRSHLDEVPG